MNDVEVIQVVRTTLTRRGNGRMTPIRCITQYWSLDGELLAEVDPRPDVSGSAVYSLPGEGIASEPRSGASRANGSESPPDAPSPVENFPGSPAGEEQHPAGVAPPCDARHPSSGAA